MRLAASNIAWPEHDDAAMARLLPSLGYEGLEIAPTRVWPVPLATTGAERVTFRRFWESRGLRVVAMQALVFGRPDLRLFGPPDSREELARHLVGMIGLAADLGAHVLVFGSPRNRTVADVPPEAVGEIACPFFRRLGEAASVRGVTFCIEPNPPQYGCDFVTTVADALALARAVGSTGFGLHLDAGGMTMTGDADTAIRLGAPHARHFHASEPNLVALGEAGADHTLFAAGLRAAGYTGWVSVEMRASTGSAHLGTLERSLALAAHHYGAPDEPVAAP